MFRLRIELLVESGCDQYALNLCNWCVRSTLYRQDVFVRQTQLLLLHKFGKLQDFYNQVSLQIIIDHKHIFQKVMAMVSTLIVSKLKKQTIECKNLSLTYIEKLRLLLQARPLSITLQSRIYRCDTL